MRPGLGRMSSVPSPRSCRAVTLIGSAATGTPYGAPVNHAGQVTSSLPTAGACRACGRESAQRIPHAAGRQRDFRIELGRPGSGASQPSPQAMTSRSRKMERAGAGQLPLPHRLRRLAPREALTRRELPQNRSEGLARARLSRGQRGSTAPVNYATGA